MCRARWLVMLCLLSAALAAGCGGDDSKQSGAGGAGGGGGGGGKDCKDADKALTDAARAHIGPLKVATDGAEGAVDRITLDVCRTTDEDATAVVIVYGMRDDSIRDVRHQLRLIKVGGLWQVTNDLDTRRCQKGRGPQNFTGEYCQ